MTADSPPKRWSAVSIVVGQVRGTITNDPWRFSAWCCFKRRPGRIFPVLAKSWLVNIPKTCRKPAQCYPTDGERYGISPATIIKPSGFREQFERISWIQKVPMMILPLQGITMMRLQGVSSCHHYRPMAEKLPINTCDKVQTNSIIPARLLPWIFLTPLPETNSSKHGNGDFRERRVEDLKDLKM